MHPGFRTVKSETSGQRERQKNPTLLLLTSHLALPPAALLCPDYAQDIVRIVRSEQHGTVLSDSHGEVGSGSGSGLEDQTNKTPPPVTTHLHGKHPHPHAWGDLVSSRPQPACSNVG